MEQPLVSVILLTFNSEKYIGRALKSVIDQNYSNLEIIVIDAGSTDSTKQVVNSFNSIEWFDLPQSDMGMARNYGIQVSNGKYLMFLDSDDLYLPNKVKMQVESLEANKDISFVCSHGYIMKNDIPLFGIKKGTTDKLSINDFLNGECYCLGSLCIRKIFLHPSIQFKEGEEGRVCEDWSFQLKLVESGAQYLKLDNPSIVVELRDDSHTAWRIQPKMKSVGLKIVNETFFALDKQKISYDVDKDKVLDRNRIKLTISYLVNHDKVNAKNSLVNISKENSSIKLILMFIILLTPSKMLASSLKWYWNYRQKSTFDWVSINEDNKDWLEKCNSFLKP